MEEAVNFELADAFANKTNFKLYLFRDIAASS